MVVSAGISLALLRDGALLLERQFCPRADLSDDLGGHAATRRPRCTRCLLILAFLLVLVGYGTKVGLAPMHSWLPDAHSESPAPVSAMLSGALLNTAMLGIVRFLRIAGAAELGEAAADWYWWHSARCRSLSARCSSCGRTDIKRLMAYSSVEHMGVVAWASASAAPLGIAGALYHMLNHSLNKSLMFFGAGNMMRAYGTKDIARIKGVGRYFPAQAALWLAGAVAITGAPPFGLFFSEFTIMRAGLQPSFSWAVYVMAILLIVIFIGFLNHFRVMYYDPAAADDAPPARRVSAWCAVPMWLAARAAARCWASGGRGHVGLPDLDRPRAVAGGAMSEDAARVNRRDRDRIRRAGGTAARRSPN